MPIPPTWWEVSGSRRGGIFEHRGNVEIEALWGLSKEPNYGEFDKSYEYSDNHDDNAVAITTTELPVVTNEVLLGRVSERKVLPSILT